MECKTKEIKRNALNCIVYHLIWKVIIWSNPINGGLKINIHLEFELQDKKRNNTKLKLLQIYRIYFFILLRKYFFKYF